MWDSVRPDRMKPSSQSQTILQEYLLLTASFFGKFLHCGDKKNIGRLWKIFFYCKFLKDCPKKGKNRQSFETTDLFMNKHFVA